MSTFTFRDFLTSVIGSASNLTVLSPRSAPVGSTGPCNDINECRTLEDIISSCFWVIFVSIWASIHPNVPDVVYVDSATSIGCLLNNAMTMLIATMAPELVMLWAMRQTYTAGRVADRFKGYGWTKAHGFLSIMKGIALYDGKDFLCYLQYSEKPPDANEEKIIKRIDKLLQQTENNREAATHDKEGRGTRNANSKTNRTSRDGSPRINEPASPTADVLASPIERHSKNTVAAGLRQREHVQPGDEPSKPVHDAISPSVNDDEGRVQDPVYGPPESRSSRGEGSSSHKVIDFEGCDPSLSFLEQLILRRLVDIPESDITDTLNHGDCFSKGIALLQTIWFVSKMIGRLSHHLYITELEVVAFTSVLLGFVAHVCWWNKPQCVRHPYRIQLPSSKLPSRHSPPTTRAHFPARFRSRCWGWVCSVAQSFWARLCSEASAAQIRLSDDYRGTRRVYDRVPPVVFVPAYPIYFLATLIGSLLDADNFDKSVNTDGNTLHDYQFFCGVDGDSTPSEIYLALYSISVMVGAIHFFSWPSKSLPGEHPQLWRSGAIILTVLPVVLGFAHYLGSRERWGTSMSHSFPRSLLQWVPTTSFNVSVWLYLAARYGLIILALLELYQLPSEFDAFRDVQFGLGFHIG
ncbi:hypothetical protein PQX77_012206 [Marasmius sp. AFHP31]|nr:hypothetical protein PQX77_012206 [Marasmius sp. AFHP31]